MVILAMANGFVLQKRVLDQKTLVLLCRAGTVQTAYDVIILRGLARHFPLPVGSEEGNNIIIL